jgi:hypothetical protein
MYPRTTIPENEDVFSAFTPCFCLQTAQVAREMSKRVIVRKKGFDL